MSSASEQIKVVWRPQPGPQTFLFHTDVNEICLAGSRGSGKSAAVLGFFAFFAERYGKAARGLIIRRKLTEMHELLRQVHQLYPLLGATYLVSTQTYTFSNGATLRFARMEDRDDARSLQGGSYSFLAFDEAQNWASPELIDMMRATLRSAEGVPVKMILTANPGGPGHHWIKARFVSPNPRGFVPIADKDGNRRIFLPCYLTDNPALMSNDPGYLDRLRLSGPPALVKAWVEGSWDITSAGVFSDVWDPARQVLEPFPIPQSWQLVCGLDWGMSRPSAVTLFAYVNDPHPPGQTLPCYFHRGSYVLIDEIHTHQIGDDGSPRYNSGRRLLPEELGELIAAKLRPYGKGRIRSAHADPNVFSKASAHGPFSVYDQMQRGMAQAGWSVAFTPANQDRIAGLQLIRGLLSEARKEKPESPGLWITSNCDAWLATVPVLESDPRRPEDIDSDSCDHIYDATRYALFSKPRIARTMKVKYG